MTDPLRLLNTIGTVNRPAPGPQRSGGGAAQSAGGADFKAFLQQQIDQVNQLQTEAQTATEDLMTGRRSDMESVIIATQKADLAFKTLLAVRNKMMDAYEEVKQIRI